MVKLELMTGLGQYKKGRPIIDWLFHEVVSSPMAKCSQVQAIITQHLI